MGKNSLSDEDKALFRQAVNALKRSGGKALDRHKIDDTSTLARHVTGNETVYLSDFYAEPVDCESVISYQKHGLPGKRFKAFRNGEIRPQARLDLHHMTIDKARDSLIDFIVREYELLKRCVIIVHGKGSHDGRAPVLKNLVNTWLRQFPQVTAFHSAHRKDGGAGAVYVLLEKRQIG